MKYESNLNRVISVIQKKLSVESINELTKEIATNIYNSSVDRIFNKGLNVKGTKIGKYKKSTKLIRQRKGLQTAFVDLTFTGLFKRYYKLRKLGFKGYTIGFPANNLYGEYITVWNEKRFKCKIFGITKEDNKMVDDLIKKFIIKVNKK